MFQHCVPQGRSIEALEDVPALTRYPQKAQPNVERDIRTHDGVVRQRARQVKHVVCTVLDKIAPKQVFQRDQLPWDLGFGAGDGIATLQLQTSILCNYLHRVLRHVRDNEAVEQPILVKAMLEDLPDTPTTLHAAGNEAWLTESNRHGYAMGGSWSNCR